MGVEFLVSTQLPLKLSGLKHVLVVLLPELGQSLESTAAFLCSAGHLPGILDWG